MGALFGDCDVSADPWMLVSFSIGTIVSSLCIAASRLYYYFYRLIYLLPIFCRSGGCLTVRLLNFDERRFPC